MKTSSNVEKLTMLILGFMVILGIFAGYYLGSAEKKKVYEITTSLLYSERDIETVQNIKVLNGLKENRLDETIRFMQTRVEGALKMEGIKESTIAEAKEYQRKYCKTPCLGL